MTYFMINLFIDLPTYLFIYSITYLLTSEVHYLQVFSLLPPHPSFHFPSVSTGRTFRSFLLTSTNPFSYQENIPITLTMEVCVPPIALKRKVSNSDPSTRLTSVHSLGRTLISTSVPEHTKVDVLPFSYSRVTKSSLHLVYR